MNRFLNLRNAEVSRWGMVVGALAAVFLAWHALTAITRTQPASASSSSNQIKQLEYATKRIEDIRVGDRVITGLPTESSRAEIQRYRGEEPNSISKSTVNPESWRLVRLRAEAVWDDGTIDDINIETLQPLAWISRHRAIVGDFVPIPLDVVEMGLPENLQAKVLAIERCPPIESGPGRVVLTTVNHLNRYLFDLTIADEQGSSATVGVTGFHKFYSADRCKWVSAANLRRGEHLNGFERKLKVVSQTQRVDVQRVFNLTVEGEHVYRVANLGALVHNNNCLDDIDDLVEVHRGIPAGHPGNAAARSGEVYPRGGHSDAVAHNRGDTESIFTSWSTDSAVAESYARANGSGGVVLTDYVPAGDLHWSPDYHYEEEVLRIGDIAVPEVGITIFD